MLPEDQRRFVEDILNLYSALHFSYEAMKFRSGISLINHVTFLGFNADSEDEEDHWVYCTELIEQGRFSELDNNYHHDFVCTWPTLNRYRLKLSAWEKMGRPDKLSRKQIIQIGWAAMPSTSRPTIRNKVRSLFRRDWRMVVAIIAGILTFLTALFIISWVYRNLGLTDPINLRGYYYVPVIAGVLLAALGGFFVGTVIYEGTLSLKERLQFQSYFAGLVFFGVVGQIWIEIFYGSHWGNLLVIILEFGTAVLAYMLIKKWREKKLDASSNSQIASEQKKSVKEEIIGNVMMFAVGAVALAAFAVYAQFNIWLFRKIETFLKGTFIEGFAFLLWLGVFGTTLIGSIILLIEINKWRDRRRKMSGTKPVDTE